MNKRFLRAFLTAALMLGCIVSGTTKAYAATEVVVLDTTVGETGPVQLMEAGFLQRNVPLRFMADVGTGDTVTIQGSPTAGGTYVTIYAFTADEWKDIYVPMHWRAKRTVDGGSADSTIYLINAHGLTVETHD